MSARRSQERGHVLLLVLMIMAAIAVAAAIFSQRVNADIRGRDDDDVRRQALWLARSAVEAGVEGHHDMMTPSGQAAVDVRDGDGSTAEVTLAGAVATVQQRPWTERFTPASAPAPAPAGASASP